MKKPLLIALTLALVGLLYAVPQASAQTATVSATPTATIMTTPTVTASPTNTATATPTQSTHAATYSWGNPVQPWPGNQYHQFWLASSINGSTDAIGYGSNQFAIATDHWLSIYASTDSSTLPRNDATSTTPDSSAKVSLGTDGSIWSNGTKVFNGSVVGLGAGGTGLAQTASQTITSGTTVVGLTQCINEGSVSISGLTATSACSVSVHGQPAWGSSATIDAGALYPFISVGTSTATLYLCNPSRTTTVTPTAQAFTVKCIL